MVASLVERDRCPLLQLYEHVVRGLALPLELLSRVPFCEPLHERRCIGGVTEVGLARSIDFGHRRDPTPSIRPFVPTGQERTGRG